MNDEHIEGLHGALSESELLGRVDAHLKRTLQGSAPLKQEMNQTDAFNTKQSNHLKSNHVFTCENDSPMIALYEQKIALLESSNSQRGTDLKKLGKAVELLLNENEHLRAQITTQQKQFLAISQSKSLEPPINSTHDRDILLHSTAELNTQCRLLDSELTHFRKENTHLQSKIIDLSEELTAERFRAKSLAETKAIIEPRFEAVSGRLAEAERRANSESEELISEKARNGELRKKLARAEEELHSAVLSKYTSEENHMANIRRLENEITELKLRLNCAFKN